MVYIIRPKASYKIRQFYKNVAKKFNQTYSIELLNKNIDDALNEIYKIENGLIRRQPTISRWKGFYMASYTVDGKSRWNYAYRIEEDTIYVEDACHAQNMSEFSSSTTPTPMPQQQKYRKLTKRPFFGYTFVMNDNKEYNLLTKDGKLLTRWFSAILPLKDPYGKYQIIAYINIGGMFCALSYNGQVYNLGKSWKEMYTENRNILNTQLFMNIIIENIDNIMKTNKKVISLTESNLRNIIAESVKKVLKENETDKRFIPSLKEIYANLHNMYERMTYTYLSEVEGVYETCKFVIKAMHTLDDAIKDIEDIEYGGIEPIGNYLTNKARSN